MQKKKSFWHIRCRQRGMLRYGEVWMWGKWKRWHWEYGVGAYLIIQSAPPSLAGQVTTVTHAVCYTVWTGSPISALKGKAAFNQPVHWALLLIHMIFYRREPLVSLLVYFLFYNVYEGGWIYKTEHWHLSKSHLNEESLLYLERTIRLLRSLRLLRLSRRGHFLLRWGNLFLRPEYVHVSKARLS